MTWVLYSSGLFGKGRQNIDWKLDICNWEKFLNVMSISLCVAALLQEKISCSVGGPGWQNSLNPQGILWTSSKEAMIIVHLSNAVWHLSCLSYNIIKHLMNAIDREWVNRGREGDVKTGHHTLGRCWQTVCTVCSTGVPFLLQPIDQLCFSRLHS